MATDIAFAVGVLALLGRRVAPALRIFLLALAIIDDVGAILVIALFYSSELAPLGFAFVVLGILFTYSLRIIGVRSPLVYVAPGMIVWAGAYIGGIHPTLAGVVIGFMTPVKAWYGTGDFLNETEARLRVLRANDATNERSLISHLKTLGVASREAVSPVERLQHMLHGWVAYGVMPLFAFANAGVRMGQISFAGDSLWVFLGVALGLLIGKPIGILAVSWMAVRSGAAVLPRGVQWPAVAVIGMVGGIGFTMALFLAQLAFPTGPFLEVSKLAILCGSGLAGIFSLLVGYRILKLQSEPVIELSRAERSTLE
jgi:NhaA family Na+:H+ antiporter